MLFILLIQIAAETISPDPHILPKIQSGCYEMTEYSRTNRLHILKQDGNKVYGWLVQENKENDGTTRWYADVIITIPLKGRYEMVIEYRHGEKHYANGRQEVWPMKQRRLEEARVLEDGRFKVYPDVWKRVGDAQTMPEDKGIGVQMVSR